MKHPCILIALLQAAVPALTHAAEKPDVLFISVDDLNDWVGCLGGHPQARTPNVGAAFFGTEKEFWEGCQSMRGNVSFGADSAIRSA